MDEITPKERILRKIREALIAAPQAPQQKTDLDTPLFAVSSDEQEVVFAEHFVRKGGKFVYCENVEEALLSLQALAGENAWDGHIFCGEESVETFLQMAGLHYGREPLDAVLKKVCCCSCRYLIANDGSVLFDSDQTGRRIFAQADTVVFIASVEQILPDFRTAWKAWKENSPRLPSMVSVWTGLSRFTDVDGGEMQGLGPASVYLVLIDNIEN